MYSTHPDHRTADVRRTNIHWRFFDVLRFDSLDDLFDAIRALDYDLVSLATARDLRSLYSGWMYWMIYVKGYLEYRDKRMITQDNSYLIYFTARCSETSLRDFVLAEQLEEGARIEADAPTVLSRVAVERVGLRFKDMDRCWPDADRAANRGALLFPIRVSVRSPSMTTDWMAVYEEGVPEPHRAARLDGHHRLFAAKLFGIETIPLTLIQEDPYLQPS